MFKKLIQQKYFILAGYFIVGLILGVIVFQFLADILQQKTLTFSSLYGKELYLNILSTLVGGLIGGFIYIALTINASGKSAKEEKLWKFIQERKSFFFFRNRVALTLAGLVGIFISKVFDLDSFHRAFQILFSWEYTSQYLAMIMAMVVFSYFFSRGIIKRLELLYQKS